MTGEELKAWRAGAKLTQQQAADRFEVNRVTWAKWEGGTLSVPDDVAEIVQDGAVEPEVIIAASAQVRQAAPVAPPAPEPLEPPAFDPVKAGLVPWGERPLNIPARDFLAQPLRKGWQVCSWRVVHGDIPDPIPFHAPDWAGKDAIVTKSGRCFHYATGREILHWAPSGVAPRPDYGSRQIDKAYKRR